VRRRSRARRPRRTIDRAAHRGAMRGRFGGALAGVEGMGGEKKGESKTLNGKRTSTKRTSSRRRGSCGPGRASGARAGRGLDRARSATAGAREGCRSISGGLSLLQSRLSLPGALRDQCKRELGSDGATRPAREQLRRPRSGSWEPEPAIAFKG
jgi:hypothetical protein